MRRAVLIAVTVATAGASLVAGTALASANDREDRVAVPADGPPFELEIDPELDARFGPRPVNAVQAAAIVTARFGGRVVEAELDEENGRPIWEMGLAGAAVDEVDVDAINGAVLGGGGQADDDEGGDD
jgi:uncharacterized membrane protein YkoI